LKQSRLIATTALVATAGIANAEVAVSGAAKAGLVYNSEGKTATRLLSSATVVFDASGESDGGLTFGFNTNYIVTNNGSVDNDDTTVYMSGAFGKISFGAVAEADEVAGLSDIGWDGLDVDDVAEALVGDELGDTVGAMLGRGKQSLGHNVNYTYATGPIILSASARMDTGHGSDGVDSYAAGAKYSFGDGYVGLGYARHSFGAIAAVTGVNADNTVTPAVAAVTPVAASTSAKIGVTSLFGGYSFGAVKVAGLYSEGTLKQVGVANKNMNAYGLNVSYTMDALTVSMGYGRAEQKGVAGAAGTQKSFGLGASYSLGGGASISGGIAQVESVGDENLAAADRKVGFKTKETRADVGVKFSF